MADQLVSSLSTLISAKLVGKFIDMLLNVLVIRHIQPSIFGLTLHFTLLLNTSQFLLKLSFKNCYLKQTIPKSDSNQQTQHIQIKSGQNLMKIGLAITSVITILLTILWIYLYESYGSHFTTSVYLYSVAGLIESSTELFHVANLINQNYKHQTKLETLSLFIKNICLFILVRFDRLPHLLSFGISQLVYSLALLLFNIGSNTEPNSDLLFRFNKIEYQGQQFYIHENTVQLTKQMTITAFLQYLLTAIEGIVLVTIGKNPVLSAQFTLVTNLGSYVPRYIYNPIETISYNYFAKNSHSLDPLNSTQIKQQTNYLESVLLTINTLGLFILGYGNIFAFQILDFLYSSQYSSSQTVLAMKFYFLYVYVMGINGITESYLHGTIQYKEIPGYQKQQIKMTTIYIILAVVLINYGPAGLVLANILVMVLRILVATTTIYQKLFTNSSQFKQFIIKLFPDLKLVLLTLIMMLAAYLVNQQIGNSSFIKLFNGSIIVVGNVLVVLINYRSQISKFIKYQ